MSHRFGEVIKDDQVVGYFEYDATTDVPISAIWQSRDEVEKHWRSDIRNDCKCGKPPADILLFIACGDEGYHYPAKACLECRAIIDDTGPYDENGQHENWPWPKEGHPLKQSCT